MIWFIKFFFYFKNYISVTWYVLVLQITGLKRVKLFRCNKDEKIILQIRKMSWYNNNKSNAIITFFLNIFFTFFSSHQFSRLGSFLREEKRKKKCDIEEKKMPFLLYIFEIAFICYNMESFQSSKEHFAYTPEIWFFSVELPWI